jgi:hypothetical protein
LEQIILWETNLEIIRECEKALHDALKELNVKATVLIYSEHPLIGRNQLWGRLPVIEIRDLRWSLRPGCAFTARDLKPLLSHIFSKSKQQE